MAPPPTGNSEDPTTSAVPAAAPSTASASASVGSAIMRTPNFGYLAASAAFIGASLVGARYLEAKALQYDATKVVPTTRGKAAAMAVLAGMSLRSIGIWHDTKWSEDIGDAAAVAAGYAAFAGREVIARTAVAFTGFGIAVYATDAAYTFFKDKFPRINDPAHDNAQGVTSTR